MEKLREDLYKLLQYGGITQNEYAMISPAIIKTNRKNAMIFSCIAIVLLAIKTLMTIIQPGNALAKQCHIGAIIVSALILLIAFLGKYNFNLIFIIVHFAQIVFLSYAYILDVIVKYDQQSTAFIVLLVLLPLLFIDKPKNTLTINIGFSISFVIGNILLKPEPTRTNNIANVIIFGTLSSVTYLIILQNKLKEFLLERRLNVMSTVDKLTGLNNRNYYEWMLNSYPDYCEKSLCCIYIDVNGLHELNNTQGHEAGDKMLKFIAEKVQEHFGKQHTYRIGGDEYVAFMIDPSSSEITKKIQELKKDIEFESYHIAVGCEKQNKDYLDIQRLIKTAEKRMYKNKEAYYEEQGKSHTRERTTQKE